MNEIELAKSEFKMVKKNPINELQALLVQVQKLNSTMQQFGDFEVMRKHMEELYWNDLSLDSKCNKMVKEIKEAMAKTNDLRTFMRVEPLAEAQKEINS